MNNYEWYTPNFIADAARDVLGQIDLDPASCVQANSIIKAKKYFTRADDGLKQEWYGKIFLNPPYSRWLIEKFVDKLLASDFEEAIALTGACTETQWFSRLATCAAGVCFITKRVRFIQADGTPCKRNPRNGSCIFYFGRNPQKFFQVFSRLGLCTQFNLQTAQIGSYCKGGD